MKPFNLEEYRKNPLRKILTRSGSKVTILCVDYNAPNKPDYPILARVTSAKGYDRCLSYTKTGAFFNNRKSGDDLFFALEKKEGWINLYKDIYKDNDCKRGGVVYSTEQEAKEVADANDDYITTIKIEWEE